MIAVAPTGSTVVTSLQTVVGVVMLALREVVNSLGLLDKLSNNFPELRPQLRSEVSAVF